MARPRFVVIRGGASRVVSGETLKARLETDDVPYGQLVEIARRRALYAALTSEAFDSAVARAGDPRWRRRRR